MSDTFAWQVKSLENTLMAHVSDYNSPIDALYEYIKNLDEVGAKVVHVDTDYDNKRVFIYGDGMGMGPDELNRISQSVGVSSKGQSHFGLGILAFMRLSKRMVIISKVGDKCCWISCTGQNDTVVSDVGQAREMSPLERRENAIAIGKLRKWEQGTITILEGVGESKTSRFDNRFDIKKEFELSTLERELKKKCGFDLKRYSCFLKCGDAKPKKISAKIGHGKHLQFTLPSKEHPLLNKLGNRRDIFSLQDRTFELKVSCDIWVGSGNDGDIRISEKGQNALDIRDAIGFRIGRDSIFKSAENKYLLQGLIDFRITPIDRGENPNVYSGSRRKILVDGGFDSFGNCLMNILNYADIEIIRPVIREYIEGQHQRRDERSSRDLQKDMDNFFKDNPDLFKDIMSTSNLDPVDARYQAKCPSCGLTVPPTRCPKCKPVAGHIYAWDDSDKYVCGTCGNVWSRRIYTKPIGRTPTSEAKPQYTTPTGSSEPRKKKHGFGFSYDVMPFGRQDTRRARIEGTMVQVSSDHPDYVTLTQDKRSIGKLMLKNYQRIIALNTIIRNECKEMARDQYEKLLEDSYCRLMGWYTKKDDETEETAVEMIKSQVKAEQVIRLRTPPKAEKDLSELAKGLGSKWGATVKSA